MLVHMKNLLPKKCAAGLEGPALDGPAFVEPLDGTQLSQLGLGIAGFLTYKVSLISVSLVPEQKRE